MSEEKASTILQRLFHTALLLFGSALLIWLTFQVLAHIWGWLILATTIGAVVTVLVLWLRHRHNRW